jgi:hypothetical protein
MQVFISHASADQPLAEHLASELQKSGINVWDAYRSLFPGDNWALETGKALAASDVMVVLLTRNSHESQTIKQDVQYALTSGNYRGRVLPVLVDFVTFQAGKDVPWILLHLEAVHVQGTPPDFRPVVERVQKISEAECNATA